MLGRILFMSEIPLYGGFVSTVVRVGDTVRRTPPENADFVRRLLVFLAERGWPGAPRFLGTDERGRDVLGYLDGHVAWQPDQPPDVWSGRSLAEVARLAREFHDLTAGSELAGDAEVVCHNDLSPKNTIYRDMGNGLQPVAFIDWDLAAPGRRIHDVAFICWQYLDLGPRIAEVRDAVAGIRLICEAYGLADRTELVETVLWWQDRCLRGIQEAAEAGQASALALRDAGVIGEVQEQRRWVREHRDGLHTGIQPLAATWPPILTAASPGTHVVLTEYGCAYELRHERLGRRAASRRRGGKRHLLGSPRPVHQAGVPHAADQQDRRVRSHLGRAMARRHRRGLR
jgi:hypothetical protein